MATPAPAAHVFTDASTLPPARCCLLAQSSLLATRLNTTHQRQCLATLSYSRATGHTVHPKQQGSPVAKPMPYPTGSSCNPCGQCAPRAPSYPPSPAPPAPFPVLGSSRSRRSFASLACSETWQTCNEFVRWGEETHEEQSSICCRHA